MLDLHKSEPTFFIVYKKKNRPHSYQDDCDDYALRDQLRKNIIAEQNSQCFYCEKKIENNTNKVHIDHIKQRDAFHTLECDYNNMVLSCNGGKKEEHCGKYKDRQESWNDDKFLRILPHNPQLQEKVSDFFNYISDGKIQPKQSLSPNETVRANNTIDYLMLNHRNLVEARKSIFLQLELYRREGFDTTHIFEFFQEFQSIFGDKQKLQY